MKTLIVLFLLFTVSAFAAEPTMGELEARLETIQAQMGQARGDLNMARLLSEHAQLRLQILGEQEKTLKGQVEKAKEKK